MSKLALRDWLNSINYTKQDIMTDDNSSQYSPYVINIALSNFTDTIFWVNEVNALPSLSNRMQYDYLRYKIRKNKRFSKWIKPEKDHNVELIMEYYDYSLEKAKEVFELLSEQQLKQIENNLYKGGTK